MQSRYSPQRSRNIFSAVDTKPYKLSRSRIENYMRCKRCFYLDRKCGTDQPPMFPYTLNNAVDALLKDEFDLYRAESKAHPYLIEHGINAIPFAHPDLGDWRMNQRGIKYHHESTNFIVTGAVDDVWINQQGELIIVDYKATSTHKDVTLNDRDSYKRQMEVYQWLFRKNGFKVSSTGYFVYCNGDSTRGKFAGTLQFNISLLLYPGDDSWIENVLLDIKACLAGNTIPKPTQGCDHCGYWNAVKKHVERHNSSQESL
ncbi:MAG: PD-(D/E)XK nuclease family protein [Candidatus Babeliales bacterium]|nr:PD-(D/E)XK nuclease family protein [Candidatus Babeliales bacterium]